MIDSRTPDQQMESRGAHSHAGRALRRLRTLSALVQPLDAGGEPCKKFYDGLPVTDNFQLETVEHFKTVQLYEDDVFLVTFPKCGTTWCWKILHSLLRMDENGTVPATGKFNKEEDFQQYWDFLPLHSRPPQKDEHGNLKPVGFCAKDLLDQPSPRL
eukprot:SAG31_NODE_11843_length_993_cov_1.092841_2_plen_157_part_00